MANYKDEHTVKAKQAFNNYITAWQPNELSGIQMGLMFRDEIFSNMVQITLQMTIYV